MIVHRWNRFKSPTQERMHMCSPCSGHLDGAMLAENNSCTNSPSLAAGTQACAADSAQQQASSAPSSKATAAYLNLEHGGIQVDTLLDVQPGAEQRFQRSAPQLSQQPPVGFQRLYPCTVPCEPHVCSCQLPVLHLQFPATLPSYHECEQMRSAHCQGAPAGAQ